MREPDTRTEAQRAKDVARSYMMEFYAATTHSPAETIAYDKYKAWTSLADEMEAQGL